MKARTQISTAVIPAAAERGCATPARKPRGPWRAGFTLLELAVVLFIIGLVMLITMPYFSGFQASELKSEARGLASRSNYLYEEAGAQKVVLRMVFDLDHNRYVVQRLDPFASQPTFGPEPGPAGQPVQLPADIRLRDVWVQGAGGFRRGVISAQFYPSGIADAALIHLVDRQGAVITLAINPFNGHAAIEHGDLSRKAMGPYVR